MSLNYTEMVISIYQFLIKQTLKHFYFIQLIIKKEKNKKNYIYSIQCEEYLCSVISWLKTKCQDTIMQVFLTVLNKALLSSLTKSSIISCQVYLFLCYQHQNIPFIHNLCSCLTAIHLMTLMVFILSFESHKYRNDYKIFMVPYFPFTNYIDRVLLLSTSAPFEDDSYTVKFSARIRSKSAAACRLCHSQTKILGQICKNY